MDTSVDDVDLAEQAAKGSSEALAELYERYADRLFDFALRTVSDAGTAEDVVQNTFIKAWGSLQRGSTPAHVKAWLFAIARNEAIDEVRRRGRQATPRADDETVAPASVPVDQTRLADPELALRDKELIDLVWESAAALNEKAYSLLDMHLRQGLSAEEMAGTLGVSSANVHKKLSRLRQSLEEAVSAELLRRRHTGECDLLDRLVVGLGEQTLTPKGRRAISKHVRSCDTCEERQRRLTAPASVFASFVPVPLALAARNEMLANVNSALGSAPDAGVPPGPAGRARNWWWTATTGARALVVAVVAAVVAVVAAVLLVVTSGDGSTSVRDPGDATSTTHVEGEPSDERQVEVAWTALDDVNGYSIDWDDRPDTLPDNDADLDGAATRATSPVLDDGEWYFHLRTEGTNGEWTSTVHLGPFVIGEPATIADDSGDADAGESDDEGDADGDGDGDDSGSTESEGIVLTTAGTCGIVGGDEQDPTPEVTFPRVTVENDGDRVTIRFPTEDALANGSLWTDRHTGLYRHGVFVQLGPADGPSEALMSLDFDRFGATPTTTFELVDIETFEPFDPDSGPTAAELILLEDGGFEFAPIDAPDGWRISSIQVDVFLDDDAGPRACSAQLFFGEVPEDLRDEFGGLMLADPSGSSNCLEWNVEWS